MLMHSTIKANKGFSMVEMLVASTVGLLVLGGVIGIFANTVGNSAQSMQTARLNQELRAVMDIMVRDIRRAGYSGTFLCSSLNPSFLDANTINNLCGGAAGQINPFEGIAINANNNCILFSYDLDKDGVVDTAAGSDERFGFRLSGGAVQMRQNGGTCTDNNWQDLSDPNTMTITGLQFTSAGSAVVGGLTVAEIQIALTGQMAIDQNVARTLVERVRSRNDMITSAITVAN